MKVFYYSVVIEVLYFLEKLTGKIWRRFLPDGKVSYWLDWLPCVFYGPRKRVEHLRQQVKEQASVQ